MSKYTILIILTVPIIGAGLLRSIVGLKLHHSTPSRAYVRMVLWLAALVMIVFAEPFYTMLITSGLTASDDLSIFDVAQIVTILLVFLVAMRAFNKAETVELHNRRLHQELSIILSKQKN